MQEVDFMYNPYQRKLIGDMIMNTLLSVLLVINLLPVNIGARIVADETPSTDPEVQEASFLTPLTRKMIQIRQMMTSR